MVVEVRRQVEVEGLGLFLLVQFFPRGIRRFLPLRALVGLLEPAVGAQVRGLVEGTVAS